MAAAQSGLSFEDVVDYLEHVGLLDDILHPNQERIMGSACTSYASASMPMKFPFTATVRLNLRGRRIQAEHIPAITLITNGFHRLIWMRSEDKPGRGSGAPRPKNTQMGLPEPKPPTPERRANPNRLQPTVIRR